MNARRAEDRRSAKDVVPGFVSRPVWEEDEYPEGTLPKAFLIRTELADESQRGQLLPVFGQTVLAHQNLIDEDEKPEVEVRGDTAVFALRSGRRLQMTLVEQRKTFFNEKTEEVTTSKWTPLGVDQRKHLYIEYIVHAQWL